MSAVDGAARRRGDCEYLIGACADYDEGNTPYVAAKGAVVSLTRAMALEAAPQNVRVNCVLPGPILTPTMLMENWGDTPPDKHPLVPRVPLRRLGQTQRNRQGRAIPRLRCRILYDRQRCPRGWWHGGAL